MRSARPTLRALPTLAALLASAPAAAFEVANRSPDEGFDKVLIDVGGFVQPRFVRSPADEAAGAPGEVGFQVARARLEVRSELFTLRDGQAVRTDRWGDSGYGKGWGIAPKMSAEMVPEAFLMDAYLDLRVRPWAMLRAGQFKSPANRTLLVSDRKTLFPERAELQDIAPRREMGAMLHGYAPQHFVEYNLAAFNGEGRNRLGNVNRKLLWMGRVAVSPLGGPGPTSELLPSNMEPTFTLGYAAHLNRIGPEGQEEGTLGHNAEAMVHWRWVTAQAEFLHQFNDWEDVSIADYNAVAWYGQLGVFIPRTDDRVALMGRFEDVEPFDPISVDVPLSGPTDENQAHQVVSYGVGLYAGRPWFSSVHELRVQLVYNHYIETESPASDPDRFDYDNDQFQVAGHFTF